MPAKRRSRRTTVVARPGGVVAALGLVASLFGVLAVGTPAEAAGTQPAFVETLAGPSQAAMYPSGLEYDASGDRLAVADTGRDRVVTYSLTGQKTGEFGSYGSGPGEFASPRDAAVDEAGNIYVADAENNRIQAFTSTGTFKWQKGGIGTANDSLNTPIGVTWDAANDVLLVASTGQSLIKAFDATGAFKWKSPTGNALGAHAMRDVERGPDGRMWVTAYKEHQIRVYDVSANGLTWNTTPAFVLGDGATNGNGVNQLNFPYNVAWSPDGDTAYVSDTGNGRIARWDLSGPDPAWLPPLGDHCDNHPQPCEDPPVDAGKFNHLRRVAVDSAGRIYGADFWGAGIEVFNPDGTSARSIEGFEPPAPGFSEAYSVDVATDGQVYVMDRLNHRIQRFRPDGTYVNKVGARGTQPATFSWPEALTVAPSGTVWAVDTRGDRIEAFPADLATSPTVKSYGNTGSALGEFSYPEGADTDSSGVVYVADTRNNRIQTFDPATSAYAAFGSLGSGPGQFNRPMGVAVTSDAVYVADTENDRVQKLTRSGAPVASFSTGLNGPEGLEVAPDGTVWVADTQNSRLVHLSADLKDLGDGFGSLGTGNAQFFNPHDLAFGNDQMYVADTYNNRVQVYSYEGGSTPPPFEPTYASQISAPGGHAPVYPAGVAVTDDGTWFAADSGGSRVVTIDPATGDVSPVASTGLTDPRDLEVDLATPTSLWVTDTGGNRLVKMSRTGTQQATLTGLNQPYGLTNDNDRVYAANTYGNNVRAYDKATNAVSWTQNSCSGKAFSRPRDVGLAGNGQLLVADTDNDRIVVLNPANGNCVSTFGTRGTGAGQFKSPRSVTSDGAGGVWVADALNYRVQHLTMTGASLGATPVNAYGDAPSQFRSPHCVTRIPGTSRVAVCDTFNFRVSVFDGAGSSPNLVSTVGGTKPVAGGFNRPFGLAYGPGGELYVADWFNHRIEKFNADGSFDRQWGGYGPQNGSLIFPRNVTVGGDGNVVVTDSENNRIDVFSPSGAFVKAVKPPAGSALSRPHQTALDGSGGYWVADTLNARVVHLSSTGSVLSSFTVAGKPQGIAVDTDGSLLVSNTANNKVERYSTGGTLVATVLGAGTPTSVKAPGSLLVTGTGADKQVWVTDVGNDRVIVLDATGAVQKIFGSAGAGAGQFETPRGIAVDPTDGDVAVADYDNDRVSIWAPTGSGGPQDGAAPSVSFTSPANGATVPYATVELRGSASDDVSVASVAVAVQRASDSQWLQPNGTWGGTQSFNEAALAEPGATSTTWSSSVPVSAPGGYTVTARATDAAARTSTSTRSFSVEGPDTSGPDTVVVAPAPKARVSGPEVTFSGSATDDVGVAAVRIAVKDRQSGLWLQDDGSWRNKASAFRLADLASPGARSTGWTLTLSLPVGHDFGFQAKAVDAAGNIDATPVWQQFQVR